jgi:hypothetical protein
MIWQCRKRIEEVDAVLEKPEMFDGLLVGLPANAVRFQKKYCQILEEVLSDFRRNELNLI